MIFLTYLILIPYTCIKQFLNFGKEINNVFTAFPKQYKIIILKNASYKEIRFYCKLERQ